MKYVEDSAPHPGRAGSDLPKIPCAPEPPTSEGEGQMLAVVEAEPLGNCAYLIAGFSKHENRRLGADSLDVLHGRDAHLFAEEVRKVGSRESCPRAQMLDAERVVGILGYHAPYGGA